METNEMILLGLCLWASGATGIAWLYFMNYRVSKLIIVALGMDLLAVGRGEMDIKIVGDRVVRTPKEKPNA